MHEHLNHLLINSNYVGSGPYLTFQSQRKVQSLAMGDDTGNKLQHTHNYNALETTAETQDKVEGAFLLNIVVRKSATVLELFASKDQTLLVRRNALLVLDLRLHVVNRVRRLHLQRDGLAGQRLDEDLHSSTETKHCRRIRYYVEDHEKSTHRGEE